MEVSRAIDLIDDKMCCGRGTFSVHHMPEYDEYWQAGEMAIDALKKQEQDRWVPVTERLPKEDCECRVTFKNDFGKSVFNCYWNEGKKQFESWDYFLDDFVPVFGVTAWKQIEEPYTEEK